jgi:hypothetical protein
MNAREHIAEALAHRANLDMIRLGTVASYMLNHGQSIHPADPENYLAEADAVLAVLPDLLTDEQVVEATARILFGGHEPNEATRAEARRHNAAAAKALTRDQP